MNAGLVIGVGNGFRRDDGVGIAVAAEVAKRRLPGVRVITATGEPGALLDAWSKARLAVVVDAAMGERSDVGQIRRWSPGESPSTGELSSHAIGIPQAFALGEALGQLPEHLAVLTVGIADAGHGPGLTPAVAAAVPAVVDAVLAEVHSWTTP